MNKINFFDDITKIKKWHDYFSMCMLIIASIAPFLFKFISFVSKNSVVDNFFNFSVPLFILYLIFSIIYFPIIFRSSKFNTGIISKAFSCILLFGLLCTVLNAIFYKFSIYIPSISNNHQLVLKVLEKIDNCETWKRIMIFFYFFFLAPFVEEIIFRVFVFRLLRNKIGIFSHIVAALIFALYSVFYNWVIDQNINSLFLVIPYFFKSIILSVTYEKLKTPAAGLLSCLFYDSINMVFLPSIFRINGLALLYLFPFYLLFIGLGALFVIAKDK